jgi:ubiquinol-cytochrome c reductase cytochrome b subunit
VLSLNKTLLKEIFLLATPKNISYFWGFGRFLAIVIVIQVATGIFLAFYYVRGSLGWESVVEITREVNGGWLVRLVHGNNASFVFLVLFIHMFRGLFQSSFYLKAPWIRGLIIIILTMISAFLGYVLPWGQMSFWGATVIINLLRILPKGKLLVIWLWGGFYVSSFTCRFFYALHFLVPLIVLRFAAIHLILLHFRGRSIPGGLTRSRRLKIKFTQLFSYKDIVNFRLLWIIWIWALLYPDWSADPVNFVVSDLSNSPLHIQPEWYFLNLYAILRSIPNKLGGLIGFALALILLRLLSLVWRKLSLAQFYIFNFIRWIFLIVNFILLWLGIQPVEEPYVFIGQIGTVIYFFYIFIVLFLDNLVFILTE